MGWTASQIKGRAGVRAHISFLQESDFNAPSSRTAIGYFTVASWRWIANTGRMDPTPLQYTA
jgi:hypothetical protein